MTSTVLLVISTHLMFVMCTTGSCGCVKEKCLNQQYSFEAQMNVTPDKDSIHVNDTIWVMYHSGKRFYDRDSINFSRATHFGNSIKIIKLNGGDALIPGVEYALDHFKFHLLTGTHIPDERFATRVKHFVFAETSDAYIFKLGLIATHPGTYGVAINDLKAVRVHDNDCKKASFQFSYSDSTDQHLYLYRDSRPGYIMSQYEADHVYFLKVK